MNLPNQMPEGLPTDKGQTKITPFQSFVNTLQTNYKFILIPLVFVGAYFAYKKYKK
jgi:hypothetical protein